jgi:hypothetical protein
MFERITFDPAVMRGRACIRGTRVTVSLVVNLVANAMSTEDIVRECPDLGPKIYARRRNIPARWLTKRSAFQEPRRVRFLADMGVSITTLQALRAAAHDARHLREEGLTRLPDIVAKPA